MMMKKYLLLLVTGLWMGITSTGQTRIGIVAGDKSALKNPEILAAYEMLKNSGHYSIELVTAKQALKSADQLNKYDILWYHKPDTIGFSLDIAGQKPLALLKSWIEQGGSLFLSLDAFRFINTLGIEPEVPKVVFKESSDSGYGRMLGFHAFRQHPLFEGLHGGAYVFKSNKDTMVRNVGFYGDQTPRNGEVVAVDWDYIFLRENIKLVAEYSLGKGKVLAVGAYLFYKPDNINRLHLEKLTLNALDYLSGNMESIPAQYWNFDPSEVSETRQVIENKITFSPSEPWRLHENLPRLQRNEASNQFFDKSGERILVMGKENGGIDEVWTHPFMAFRDIKTGIQFPGSDKIEWLDQYNPVVENTPAAYIRTYRIRETVIREIITASPSDPVMVCHYDISGKTDISLYCTFKTNLRMMWPYSETVTGAIHYSWDEANRCFMATDRSGETACMIGTDKKLSAFGAGRYDGFEITGPDWKEQPTGELKVSGYFSVRLHRTDQFNIMVAGSNLGMADAQNYYRISAEHPDQVYGRAASYYDYLKSNTPQITTPDTDFNEGYQWAVIGTDQFFVNTPGIGKSLVAGYSTTDYGWDGEHKVNGRPGYAWYFGRDAEWSGFALLPYGDFEKVRLMLETFNKYQDLNGKIYHELSTSGFAHYDASDATPLYIVLAGKYLKHSGDVEFIRKTWPNIQKALQYCYSTDTDGDGLIENTNVGHGWEEGGGLFGCHTTFYLASCWAEALKMAALMAKVTGKEEEAAQYQADADRVVKIINTDFWNENDQYFYHGLMPDGTMKSEKSVMPAIPILFGQVDEEKAMEVARVTSGNAFTSDWGVRIVSEFSSMFNPRGYHTGSVWPLFTGWTALSDYKTGNNLQGFSHIMNNLLVYKHWAHGYVEEVLNGTEFKPSGVCHHQCWSETMVLQPIFEGMLGFTPDAANNTVDFSPRLPAHWDHFAVNNLRFGDHSFNFEMKKENGKTKYILTNTGYKAFQINFGPDILSGAKLYSTKTDGKMIRLSPQPGAQSQMLSFRLTLEKSTEIEIETKGGISILPIVSAPMPGDKSGGFRIISADFREGVYEVLLEGRSGESYQYQIYTDGWKPEKFKNTTYEESFGNLHTFRVKFPEVDSRYARQRVSFSVPVTD